MNCVSSVDNRIDASLPVTEEATECEIEREKINSKENFDQGNKRFRDGTFRNQRNSQLNTADETSLNFAIDKTIQEQNISLITNTQKTRDQLLKLLDCVVLAFNVADFNILAKTLSDSFASDATIKIRLFPKETNPYVQPNTSLKDFTTTDTSSVLLLWMLLHKTHPDGVMQIIDKRICFRQILHKPWVYPSTIRHVSNNYKGNNGAAVTSSSTPTATTGTTVPVSIIETVIKFTGSCLTLHSIHELYSVLAEEGLRLLTQPTTTDSASRTSRSSAVQLRPEVFSEYISAFLAHELLSTSSSLSVGTAVGDTSISAAAISTKQHQQHRDCRYLIEIVQIFNDQGLVVDYSFTVLAAESTH